MRRGTQDARDEARAVTAVSCENVKGSLTRRVDAEVNRLEALMDTIDGKATVRPSVRPVRPSVHPHPTYAGVIHNKIRSRLHSTTLRFLASHHQKNVRRCEL